MSKDCLYLHYLADSKDVMHKDKINNSETFSLQLERALQVARLNERNYESSDKSVFRTIESFKKTLQTTENSFDGSASTEDKERTGFLPRETCRYGFDFDSEETVKVPETVKIMVSKICNRSSFFSKLPSMCSETASLPELNDWLKYSSKQNDP